MKDKDIVREAMTLTDFTQAELQKEPGLECKVVVIHDDKEWEVG